MGFPRDVRDQALVLAARHCCVCHRYKGVCIEVHHIEQESKGGANDLENAVALCFDCHAAAGHYNPSHPRGTRYSPTEIRKARDLWHGIVASGKVQPVESSSGQVLLRHYVCSDWNAIREISQLDLAKVPISKPLLQQNEVFSSLCTLIAKDERGFRHEAAFGRSFGSLDELKNAVPEAAACKDDDAPTFEARRALSDHDLKAADDFLSLELRHEGVALPRIGDVLYRFEGCGGQHIEVFRLRRLNLVLLEVKNVSNEPLRIVGYRSHARIEKRLLPISYAEGAGLPERKASLPKTALMPGESVVIPEALALSPIVEPLSMPEMTVTQEIGRKGEYYFQTVDRVSLETNQVQGFDLVGSVDLVSSVQVADASEEVHEFDFQNVYSISRHWACGSCPHIFVSRVDRDAPEYRGPLFSRPGEICETRMTLEATVHRVVVSELEQEVTTISHVDLELIDGSKVRLCDDLVLGQGEAVEFDIARFAGKVVAIVAMGTYQPIAKPDDTAEATLARDALVRVEIRRLASTRRAARCNVQNGSPDAADLP